MKIKRSKKCLINRLINFEANEKKFHSLTECCLHLDWTETLLELSLPGEICWLLGEEQTGDECLKKEKKLIIFNQERVSKYFATSVGSKT